MTVGLFLPCYVNQFYPQYASLHLLLLEKLGWTVEYPLNQTCCGQPMVNSGYESLSKDCSELFTKNFSAYDYIVCPSGSCVMNWQIFLAYKIIFLIEFICTRISLVLLWSVFRKFHFRFVCKLTYRSKLNECLSQMILNDTEVNRSSIGPTM